MVYSVSKWEHNVKEVFTGRELPLRKANHFEVAVSERDAVSRLRRLVSRPPGFGRRDTNHSSERSV